MYTVAPLLVFLLDEGPPELNHHLLSAHRLQKGSWSTSVSIAGVVLRSAAWCLGRREEVSVSPAQEKAGFA